MVRDAAEEVVKAHADSVCDECGHWHPTGDPTVRYVVCPDPTCQAMRILRGQEPCARFIERRTEPESKHVERFGSRFPR